MSDIEPRVWAPTVNARVVTSHPLAAGLVAALLPIAGVGAVDLTSGERHTIRGAPGHGATAYGYGMTNPAAGDGTDYTIGSSHKLALQPPLSFMWVGNKVGAPDANSLMFGVYYDNASGSPFTCYGMGFDGAATAMRCPEGNSSGSYVGFATFSLPADGPHVYICVIDPGGIQGWDNGVQQVTNSGWSAINYSATSGFTFHNHPTARAVGHTSTFGAVWNRALSANEISALTTNPFAMLSSGFPEALSSVKLGGQTATIGIAAETDTAGVASPVYGPGVHYVKSVGTVTDITAGTTSTITVAAGGVPVGDMVAILGSCDNTGANGIATTIAVADNSSQAGTANAYTLLTPQAIADPGAASAGQQGFFVYCKLTRALLAGDVITVTYGNSTAAKAIAAHHLKGEHQTTPILSGTYTTQDNQTSTTVSVSATPTAAHQMVMVGVAVEGGTADTYTEDNDTTNGTWTTLPRLGSGTTTSGATLNSAYKIVNASGAQTYNPTLGTARDHAAFIVVVDFQPAAGLSAAAGVASETDTALALARTKAKTLGIASTTSTAIALGRAKSLLISPASTTSTAIAVGRVKARTLGAATETDQAMGVAMVKGAKPALETDSAVALGRVKARLLGLATETDTAQGVQMAKVAKPATETDTAGRLFAPVVVSAASETDLALPVGRTKARAVTAALEADTAQGVALAKGIKPALETDTAQGVAMAKGLGVAIEVDTAMGVAMAKRLNIATETDTARPLTRVHARTLGIAAEADSARLLGMRLGINAAVETDVALQAGHGNTRTILIAVETDTARPIARAKAKTLGAGLEADTALPLARRHARLINAAVETDTGGVLARGKARVIGAATEADVARVLAHLHGRLVGVATEFDTTLEIGGAAKPVFVGRRRTRRGDVERVTVRIDGVRRTLRVDLPRTTARIS